MVVIAIIGVLATMILTSLFMARDKARDAKREAEISQIGRFLTMSCYSPDMEESEYGYDLVDLADELIAKNPKYEKFLSNIPRDPWSGTSSESNYFYVVNEDNSKCAIYANLESSKKSVALPITEPTPGGGTGVFEGDAGWNGSNLYFQYSN